MNRQVTCLLLDINSLLFFFFFAISFINPVKLTVGATVYSESYWPPQERRDQDRNHKKAYPFLHGATSSMLAPKFSSSISSRSQRVGHVILRGFYECLSIVAPKAAETVRTLIALARVPQSASILPSLGSCSAMLSNRAGWTISTRWKYGPNNMPAL